MPRPIRATFDHSALRANLALAKARAPKSRVWAVVKANAYGHGLLRAAQALHDADGFALLDLDDAIRLRDAGSNKPILLLEGAFETQDLSLAAEYSLTCVVHCDEQIEMLETAGLPQRVPVYCKMNSGMNRLGFSASAFPKAVERLARCPGVGRLTLMTHFAEADTDKGVEASLSAFNATIAQARELVAADGDGNRSHAHEMGCSLANSAAILRYPATHADWIRPGIMLYGCSPFENESAEALGLRPVMTLTSEVIGVQDLKKGERTGYGGLFKAPKGMRIGIVACGYADGYPRHAPTGTPVLVEGIRTRTLGRVSMDMIAVDLSEVPNARIGSPVTLWGAGLSADEVARAAGTVSYELLCALAARVPQMDNA